MKTATNNAVVTLLFPLPFTSTFSLNSLMGRTFLTAEMYKYNFSANHDGGKLIDIRTVNLLIMIALPI